MWLVSLYSEYIWGFLLGPWQRFSLYWVPLQLDTDFDHIETCLWTDTFVYLKRESVKSKKVDCGVSFPGHQIQTCWLNNLLSYSRMAFLPTFNQHSNKCKCTWVSSYSSSCHTTWCSNTIMILFRCRVLQDMFSTFNNPTWSCTLNYLTKLSFDLFSQEQRKMCLFVNTGQIK